MFVYIYKYTKHVNGKEQLEASSGWKSALIGTSDQRLQLTVELWSNLTTFQHKN